MAGQQTAQNGKCPEGYTHVFGPLCVEQTKLAKFEELLPDMPKVDLTDPPCEAALAALKSAADALETILEAPRKLKKMAKDIINRPFKAAEKIANSVLGIIDELNQMIDDILGGAGVLKDLAKALEKVLSCPFLADTPLGKAAAALLDAIDGGLPITGLLEAFKEQMSGAVKDKLKELKKLPLSAIDGMEKTLNDMLERYGVGKLLQQLEDLEKCVKSLCNLVKVAKRLPAKASDFLESLDAAFDSSTGKLKAALTKPVTVAEKEATALAKSLAVVKLTK